MDNFIYIKKAPNNRWRKFELKTKTFIQVRYPSCKIWAECWIWVQNYEMLISKILKLVKKDCS